MLVLSSEESFDGALHDLGVIEAAPPSVLTTATPSTQTFVGWIAVRQRWDRTDHWFSVGVLFLF